MSTNHRIIHGDSRNMKSVDDRSVHLIITSPPYWQLKDYGSDNQIGYNDSYEEYINNLNIVWQECHRVLHPGCRLCINIGDQFARSVYYGRYKVIPIRTEIVRFCETIGFDYMGAIIWQKVTTTNTTGGATIMGSYPYPRNGILKLDYEFIMIFKKQGNPPKTTKEQKQQSIMSKEEWNQYFTGHWNFAGAKQDQHIAMFPEELPRRLIKMFAFVGDTVLDPFLGSGTTCLAAKNTGRNSIGIEINQEFMPIIKKKLNLDQLDISGTSFEFVDEYEPFDVQSQYRKLPYLFNDPLKLDKKVDPKKLQYGSKIDKEKQEREEFFSVRKVLSPALIQLSNGLVVRLIGIKEKDGINGEATKFLLEKTMGQKVFMKFDNEKFDRDRNLLCYLYLSNKTMLNYHLIKEGLADVDSSYEYKYRTKFIELGD